MVRAPPIVDSRFSQKTASIPSAIIYISPPHTFHPIRTRGSFDPFLQEASSSFPSRELSLLPAQLSSCIMSYPTLRANLPPGTPQRPLPGAFLQTPAPTHTHNVVSAGQSLPVPAHAPGQQTQTQTQTQTPLPRMAPAVTQISNRALTVEERGAHTINNTLAQEARYPDLDSYLSRKPDLFSALFPLLCSPMYPANLNRGILVRL